MARFVAGGAMTGVGAIVRLLMLGTCLVPFTSTRQAIVFVSTPPASEEEETGREQEGAGKDKARKYVPPASRPPAVSARPLHARPSTPHGAPTIRSPSPLDPFRNGLGCPFRC